jgi:glycosyltransferase involved in cell wall biosynthesis
VASDRQPECITTQDIRRVAVNKVKLAIVCTHPIQYYAPVFRALAQSDVLEPRVFYTWSQTAQAAPFDPDFGMRFAWNIPLLEGYKYLFVENTAKHPWPGRFFGVKTPTLSREIAACGADAVLVFGWPMYAHLHLLLESKGKLPVLFRGDSTLLDPIKPLRKLARYILLRWVYSHVDMAIAVGQNSRDYFQWCGLPSERIAFAPHSVDTLRFGDPTGEHERKASQWRTELGIPDASPVLLFAGKFTEKKDPLSLLEAFAKLNSSAHLVLAGSGQLENSLRDRARERANVHFLPFQNQSEMPSVYRLADLFVLPSRGPGETWGLAMNEAMASGRPVIAGSRVGGARDLIEVGSTGWVFDSGNVAALVDVLDGAIALGREGLLKMGETARKSISNWSTAVAAKGIESATLRAISAFNANS